MTIVGNPDGNGYRFGHRLILTGNILAAALFIFQLAWHWIPSPDVGTPWYPGTIKND
jgi:hypothetical protein